MKKKEGKEFSVKWAEWVLNHKLLVTIGVLLIVAAAGSGMARLTMSSDYRYFFKEGNEQRLAFDQLQKIYTKDDTAIVAIQAPEGDVFNPKTLALVQEFTDAAWQAPYSYRVDSITNFQNTVATEDELVVRDLFREGDVLDQAQLDYIRNTALNEPLLAGQLVSTDGKATAINVRFNLPGKTPFEVSEVATYIRELAASFQKDYPEHQFRFSGIIMMNNAFNEAGLKDMMTLTPLMYLVLIGITVFFLKSFFGTLATLAVLFLSVIAGMGIGGYLGIPITPPSAIAPTVILTLAIADSVHVLKSIFFLMGRGVAKREAIIEGVRVNFQPVFLTSLTTAIGFLALNSADTPPLHDLGNLTAVGVGFAFLFSVTILPVMISVLPIKVKQVGFVDESKRWSGKLSQFVHINRFPVLIVTMLGAIALFFQVPNIRLNDQFVRYFSEELEFRQHSDWIIDNMAGIYQVEFHLQSSGPQGLTDPEFLKTVDDFVNMYREIPEVTHVNSITDTFKRLNKNMHGDDALYYALPEQSDLASQYLLLYEMSLPYGLDLNNQIDIDKSSTRVIVTFTDVDTNKMIEIGKAGEDWLKANAPEYMHTIATSPTVMFSRITHNNVKSMFWGTLLAFGLITLTLIVALRSIKYGLISLFPNLIPAGMALGVWSLGIGQAGFAISVVASVTLGVVVDDTVHFLTKYVRAKREKELQAVEAIRDSFANVGSALVATSTILVAGFGVMMMSTFKMNWVLGALSAMTIALALFIDFSFLPALLSIVDNDKKAAKKA